LDEASLLLLIAIIIFCGVLIGICCFCCGFSLGNFDTLTKQKPSLDGKAEDTSENTDSEVDDMNLKIIAESKDGFCADVKTGFFDMSRKLDSLIDGQNSIENQLNRMQNKINDQNLQKIINNIEKSLHKEWTNSQPSNSSQTSVKYIVERSETTTNKEKTKSLSPNAGITSTLCLVKTESPAKIKNPL
jgi:hypothetical protein